MTDFVSGFWPWFIALTTIASIAGLFWLTIWLSGGRLAPGEKAESMGHMWDGDLHELNNPLPRWWLNMFYITLVFGVVYLLLYPGLGSFGGFLGWTQKSQYEGEIASAEAKYGPLFEQYSQQSLKALGRDPTALKMGERLYATYCTGCHGSDARGGGQGSGFPNLRDTDWLYGGSPEAIEQSILNGRSGMMPAWRDALGGDAGVRQVAQYVLSLSDRKVDPQAAEEGKQKFQTFCAACHGPEGKGMQALGAPDLTDNIWLYGGSERAVFDTIANGRQGKMPAHKEFLGEAKVHLLAAYIYNLSQQ